MQFKLYKVSGYEEAIMSLRMSKGKYFSLEKADEIQDLVYVVTDKQGRLATEEEYNIKIGTIDLDGHKKVTGDYETDVAEFKRLLTLTFNNAMGEQKHHTLMKYIDITFFTDGLHRGAQDDLDAHAIAFNNRITRFSTRLAEIDEQKVSEWYQDKVIPFDEALKYFEVDLDIQLPYSFSPNDKEGTFVLTPFGYVLEKYAQVPAKNGLAKDVQRGLMALGTPGCAIWKTDFFNLRYVYSMRSKLTKASPELKIGMEQLADQIEEHIPVFGEYFRKVFTDTKQWEHVNKVRTITSEEYQFLQKMKKEQGILE